MYKVYVKYGGMEYPLHEPLDDDVRIMDPVLTEEIGSAGSFSFQIYRGHPNYDKIRPCKSEVILDVYKRQTRCRSGRNITGDMLT